ncbi:hypothetical protein [Ferrimonas senticii]|nr:hypothetical protein [Ferrimonas senticii]
MEFLWVIFATFYSMPVLAALSLVVCLIAHVALTLLTDQHRLFH